MACSFSNAKFLSAFITKANRRGFSATAAAPQGVVSTVKKTEEEKIGYSEKVAWIPDPRNGCYRPENVGEEIDAAELRALLLKKH
ncbi:hypothetical protein P3X46_024402 [Hevea brasiliensis]|uniref:Uncharacterized protein n=1 Tax=Hevea brasiliensis TaxID=3981 RepID=A0ABQ9L3F3_HEVBR|nr:late embryogenis abundant protein 2-like [Hevea brasiliensis]KAJ9158858.1 hypothetical protein P3X46_024402 [Hevea brasiliensis]